MRAGNSKREKGKASDAAVPPASNLNGNSASSIHEDTIQRMSSSEDEDFSNEDSDEEDASDEDEEADSQAIDKLMGLLGDVDPYELGLANENDEVLAEGDKGDPVDGIDEDEMSVSEQDDNSVSKEDDEDFDEVSELRRTNPAHKSLDPRSQDIILDQILARFKLNVPFFETQTLTYPETLDIPDVADDLQRELQFYKQSLWAAQNAYKLFRSSSVPFTRPTDYYAEMLKTDDHMEKIRQKLLDESAGIKASEAAKKQRHLKKFGKAVQVEKVKERAKTRRDLSEKVKEFKKKRKNNPGENDGAFDVDIVNENSSSRRLKQARNESIAEGRSGRGGSRGGRGGKTRTHRDSKFGFSKASRRPKENDRESANDVFGKAGRGGKAAMGSLRGGRVKSKRPGKSRRHQG